MAPPFLRVIRPRVLALLQAIQLLVVLLMLLPPPLFLGLRPTAQAYPNPDPPAPVAVLNSKEKDNEFEESQPVEDDVFVFGVKEWARFSGMGFALVGALMAVASGKITRILAVIPAGIFGLVATISILRITYKYSYRDRSEDQLATELFGENGLLFFGLCFAAMAVLSVISARDLDHFFFGGTFGFCLLLYVFTFVAVLTGEVKEFYGWMFLGSGIVFALTNMLLSLNVIFDVCFSFCGALFLVVGFDVFPTYFSNDFKPSEFGYLYMDFMYGLIPLKLPIWSNKFMYVAGCVPFVALVLYIGKVFLPSLLFAAPKEKKIKETPGAAQSLHSNE